MQWVEDSEGLPTPAMTLADLRSHDTSQVAQDLGEALKREKRLKTRVQELVATVEKLSKNSEIRHQQSAQFVNDLKRANRSACILSGQIILRFLISFFKLNFDI